ncbi:MAG: multidrug efflux MFS transporter [Lentisphaerae bacterium]|nr:multidrug efflux MFS transporter [Lentisphaerota bacterium]
MENSDTRHWKLNLAMMWFSQMMVMTGFAALMPFIPLFFKNQLGMTDEGTCGLYVSYFNVAGSLAYTVFIPIWGILSDRFGVKIMLLRGTFGTALIFPLMGFVHSAWLLIGLRFLTAACAGTTAASQTLIVKNTPDDKIGFALGIFSTAFWSGATLGYVAGGLIVHWFGYQSAFIFCGLLYFIGGVSVLFAHEDCKTVQKKVAVGGSQIKPHHRSLLPQLTTVVWVILILFACNGFVRSFEAAYPAMLIDTITSGKDAAYWTGIISAFASVGAMVSGALFGYLSDHIKPEKLLVPALGFTALTLLMQAMAGSLWIFGAGRTLMFLSGGGIQPIFQKALSSVTPKRKRGTVFGFASTFNGIGTIAAAFVAGVVINYFNTRGVFYAAAILTAALIPVALFLLKIVYSSPFYRSSVNKKKL